MCRVVADVASKEWSDPTVVAAAIAADAAFAPFVAAARGVLESAVADDGRVDRAWVEEALSFPGVGALVQRLKPIDPLLVHAVVKARSISHWSPYDPVGVVNADP
jgi:aminopeptidase N